MEISSKEHQPKGKTMSTCFDAYGNEIDSEEAFKDLLDADGQTITVAGLEFLPPTILEDCDPVAFRVYLNDYESDMVSDGEWFEENPINDDQD